VNSLKVSVPSSLQKANLDFGKTPFVEFLTPKMPKIKGSMIYVTRSKKRGRTIENSSEIDRLLTKSGFEIIDTEGMSILDQATIFNNSAIVVGVHGAGLTNLLFHQPGQLSLFEIFHPDFAHPHYRWMAGAYNFAYQAIVGDFSLENGNFQLDPIKFKSQLDTFLARVVTQ